MSVSQIWLLHPKYNGYNEGITGVVVRSHLHQKSWFGAQDHFSVVSNWAIHIKLVNNSINFSSLDYAKVQRNIQIYSLLHYNSIEIIYE